LAIVPGAAVSQTPAPRVGVLAALVTIGAMLVGVSTAAAMTAAGHIYLWTAWWSFVAASAALIATSAFTTPKSDDELRGLVAWVR
jgi:hypothetical protein